MATKVFLDTNIVIDFFDPIRPGHKRAIELLSFIEKGEIEGFVSESVLNVSIYIWRKQFSVAAIREILSDMLTIIDVLSCTRDIYTKSLNLTGKDIEDAILYQIALENELDFFITEDKKDFQAFSLKKLPVLPVKEFLQING